MNKKGRLDRRSERYALQVILEFLTMSDRTMRQCQADFVAFVLLKTSSRLPVKLGGNHWTTTRAPECQHVREQERLNIRESSHERHSESFQQLRIIRQLFRTLSHSKVPIVTILRLCGSLLLLLPVSLEAYGLLLVHLEDDSRCLLLKT